MERMVGGQPVCMPQSWSGWGRKDETRDGEKVKNFAEEAESLDLDIFKSSFTSELKL